jgi:hypothetical protein
LLTSTKKLIVGVEQLTLRQIKKQYNSISSVLSADEDVAPALARFFNLNDDLKELGTDVGFLGQRAICGGLCIFLAGVVVGMLASK